MERNGLTNKWTFSRGTNRSGPKIAEIAEKGQTKIIGAKFWPNWTRSTLRKRDGRGEAGKAGGSTAIRPIVANRKIVRKRGTGGLICRGGGGLFQARRLQN